MILFLEFFTMEFLPDQDIFEMHNLDMGQKNNDEMAKKTHKKAKG